jgi:hypothetical protein
LPESVALQHSAVLFDTYYNHHHDKQAYLIVPTVETPSVAKQILPVGHQITHGLLSRCFIGSFTGRLISLEASLCSSLVGYCMLYLHDQDQQKLDGKKRSGTGKLSLFGLIEQFLRLSSF